MKRRSNWHSHTGIRAMCGQALPVQRSKSKHAKDDAGYGVDDWQSEGALPTPEVSERGYRDG
jgi:hypothetical protein